MIRTNVTDSLARETVIFAIRVRTATMMKAINKIQKQVKLIVTKLDDLQERKAIHNERKWQE